MTTTASEVYADVVLLYELNIFQSRPFLIKIYDIFKNNILTCSCWASVESWLLSIESAIQWFQIHNRIAFATIQNPAVYLSGARVSIFLLAALSPQAFLSE